MLLAVSFSFITVDNELPKLLPSATKTFIRCYRVFAVFDGERSFSDSRNRGVLGYSGMGGDFGCGEGFGKWNVEWMCLMLVKGLTELEGWVL